MAWRVWEYNVLATLAYEFPTLSFVIYLKRDSKIAESPVVWALSISQEIHRFHFQNIKLWEVDPEVLRHGGLVGLFPLLPLTQAGLRPEVVEEAIIRVQADGGEASPELLSLIYLLAELICENDEELLWLDRRFAVLYDVLQESRAYQKIKQEGRKEILQEVTQKLLGIVEARFPDILDLARKQTTSIDDPTVLVDLTIKMSMAQTVEEARQNLLILDEEQES
jgi:hypothetical protein